MQIDSWLRVKIEGAFVALGKNFPLKSIRAKLDILEIPLKRNAHTFQKIDCLLFYESVYCEHNRMRK